ncbi:pantetheine-phosphate adenylyltransferase [Streptococcus ratti]|uniref:Phosphopantetheine adenylyltransferase n=2 Tax=Streptococcus ratti TaxID=1341 RepID=A0A7X9QGE3_STRRT|nr:pantetheine-phosphate adenylyltransferase [Streptococcus ratti]VEI59498.1 phosphopantetheine adenylyltransferase [Streptococcus mutans]EJN95077.1 phosphopantetheine adenylyltransferase [Streptococcus ratti FA-1 = DSM 20564]EMP70467.1 phosphopantetheine adenylyltransferase [Streptococcus ratti FA-1 = DSM 20564]NMD49373.1 pantetheine-phosphate adenylyltransferase [Streptococcus ratti]QEY07075.1 pantetheine-phosphate adenylyltransferase [Streptococcus ratti]
MSDKIGLFAGSFDPVTNGHVDIIRRASKLFDKLYVGLFYNKNKTGLFEPASRQKMLKEALADLKNVEVIVARDSLAVDIARQHGVTHLVRGLRNAQDLEYEANLAFFNSQLAQEIETVFLLTALDYRYLSSSRIRELIYFKADISPYVPQAVVKEVEQKSENNQKI